MESVSLEHPLLNGDTKRRLSKARLEADAYEFLRVRTPEAIRQDSRDYWDVFRYFLQEQDLDIVDMRS